MAATIRPKYVVPNLVTLVGLSFGLVAIARCLEGDFVAASWWIILCVLLDKLDGFAARRLHAQSSFGVQMDSLSDLVTFCVAPTVLLLAVTGAGAGVPVGTTWSSFGVLAAGLLFVAAGALRLARFNVCTDEVDPHLFQGFPTTFCGGLLVTAYLVAAKHGVPELWLRAAPFAYVALALLMVSNIPMPKFGPSRSRLLNVVIGANLAASYVCGVLRVAPEYLAALILTYVVFGGGHAWLARLRAGNSGLAPRT
jgi:CDP-diacylglycerol--serine O-phosphatidyltransferase